MVSAIFEEEAEDMMRLTKMLYECRKYFKSYSMQFSLPIVFGRPTKEKHLEFILTNILKVLKRKLKKQKKSHNSQIILTILTMIRF